MTTETSLKNFPSLARRAASVLNTLITLPDEDARALVLRTDSADEMEDAQMEAAMALSALRIHLNRMYRRAENAPLPLADEARDAE